MLSAHAFLPCFLEGLTCRKSLSWDSVWACGVAVLDGWLRLAFGVFAWAVGLWLLAGVHGVLSGVLVAVGSLGGVSFGGCGGSSRPSG